VHIEQGSIIMGSHLQWLIVFVIITSF